MEVIMRIEQLQYLIAIHEYHSIRKAAERLFISQPAISKAIHLLEDEFGTPLVERDNQGTLLTEKGVRLVELSKNFLLECEKIKVSPNPPVIQNITIYLEKIIAPSLWPKLFLHFYDNYPQLRLSRVEYSYNQLETVLSNKNCDICYSYLSPENIENLRKKYHVSIISKDILGLVIPNTSSLANYNIISLSQLIDKKILLNCNKDDSTLITEILQKFPNISMHNTLVFQASEPLSSLLFKNDDIVQIQPLLRNEFLHKNDTLKIIPLKENFPIYLCCIYRPNCPLPAEILDIFCTMSL